MNYIISQLNSASWQQAESLIRQAVAELSNASCPDEEADQIGCATIQAAKNWELSVKEVEEQISQLDKDITKLERDIHSAESRCDKYVKEVDLEAERRERYYEQHPMELRHSIPSGKKTKIITNKAAYEAEQLTINDLNAELRKLTREKEGLEKKIKNESKKIKDSLQAVFKTPKMQESRMFLQALVSSGLIKGTSLEKEVKGRYFYITNMYRKEFDAFNTTLKAGGEKFSGVRFEQNPESLVCGGNCNYETNKTDKKNKFKGKLNFALTSTSQSEIHISYKAKNEFLFKNEDVEKGTKALKEAAKNFVISVDGKIVTAKLDVKKEDSGAVEEVQKFEEVLEAYRKEGEALLAIAKENKASVGGLGLAFNKAGNFVNKHKKLFIAVPSVIALLVLVMVGKAVVEEVTYKNEMVKEYEQVDGWTEVTELSYVEENVRKVIGGGTVYTYGDKMSHIIKVPDEKVEQVSSMIADISERIKTDFPDYTVDYKKEESDAYKNAWTQIAFKKFPEYDEDGITSLLFMGDRSLRLITTGSDNNTKKVALGSVHCRRFSFSDQQFDFGKYMTE